MILDKIIVLLNYQNVKILLPTIYHQFLSLKTFFIIFRDKNYSELLKSLSREKQ